MEAVREGKQNIVTDLRKAASDLTVVLDEYRRQEAAVLRESDSYDKSFAGISGNELTALNRDREKYRKPLTNRDNNLKVPAF